MFKFYERSSYLNLDYIPIKGCISLNIQETGELELSFTSDIYCNCNEMQRWSILGKSMNLISKISIVEVTAQQIHTELINQRNN